MRSDAAGARLPLTVAVTGATGLIGSALVARLRSRGHTVRRVVRSSRGAGPSDVLWNPDRGELDAQALGGVDAVVNLAGAPITRRWTAARKRAIHESRVRSTELLARAIAGLQRKPRVFLSGSAVGFYGDCGDEVLDEASGAGAEFLARVTADWEAATGPAVSAGIRVVTLRTGVVLAPHGGALAKLLPIFRLGGGGPLGSGRQWIS
ncbi:MAG TPA: TIGR01777 family oxidoreductase [Gemmatimonadaceae bacterium]